MRIRHAQIILGALVLLMLAGAGYNYVVATSEPSNHRLYQQMAGEKTRIQTELERLKSDLSEVDEERHALKDELLSVLSGFDQERHALKEVISSLQDKVSRLRTGLPSDFGAKQVPALAPERVWEIENATIGWKYREFGPQCSKKLHVVYFAYIPEDPALRRRWRGIIGNQMAELKEESRGLHGLLRQSCLHAVISFPSGNFTQANEALLLIRGGLPDYISLNVTLVPKNFFEYPGILKVWQLSVQCPECIVGYFHSKGMANHKDVTARHWLEAVLTRAVILDWKYATDIIKNRDDVNKVGFTCSREGFLWNNFFWARSSYVVEHGPPYVKHPRGRFHYEYYIGENMGLFNGASERTRIAEPRDCYSLSYDGKITANALTLAADLDRSRELHWYYFRDVMRHPLCPAVSDDWNPNSDPQAAVEDNTTWKRKKKKLLEDSSAIFK